MNPGGAGSGQSTHPLSPSEKIAHGGNRTRGSLPLAPWPEERQPTELPPPPPMARGTMIHEPRGAGSGQSTRLLSPPVVCRGSFAGIQVVIKLVSLSPTT